MRCSVHLLADPALVDVCPLGEGVRCDRCTEPVRVTTHAARRWELRVGGPWSGEDAIREFIKGAYTPEVRPPWIGVKKRFGQEILLNDRFTGVALLKHRSIDRATIITVLTSEPASADWRRADPARPGWRLR